MMNCSLGKKLSHWRSYKNLHDAARNYTEYVFHYYCYAILKIHTFILLLYTIMIAKKDRSVIIPRLYWNESWPTFEQSVQLLLN